jgi:hypothetical protein
VKPHDIRHAVRQPWSTDQCRICWLSAFDERYSPTRGPRLPVVSDTRRPHPVDCQHRGLVAIGGYGCGCSGGWQVPVYPCAVVGACSYDGADAARVRWATGATTDDVRVQSCRSCEQRSPSKILDNPHVPTVRDYPRPQIAPERRVRIDESQWPKADRHFQASVVPWQGKLWCATRKAWSRARVVLSELDADYQVVRWREMKPDRREVNQTGDEDPRLFVWRGQLWLLWTAWDSVSRPRIGKANATTPMLSKVNEDLTISDTRVIGYAGRRSWEKNWQPFGWDDGVQDRLMAVYQPSATGIVLEIDDVAARFAANVSAAWPDNLGLVRGGAPPARRGEEQWSVCHAVYRAADGRQWYAATLHTFDAAPPFTPRRYLPYPLIDPRSEGRAPRTLLNEAVVFPCGSYFAYGGERFVVSCGWHDRWAEVWEFDAELLDVSMMPFPGAERHRTGVAAMAWEYSAAMVAWLSAGRPTRSDAAVQQIVATCSSNQCGEWQDGHCGACGCPVNDGGPLSSKARMATEKCPKGFWI